MALQDFIQALQEQDVIYSTPPQPAIRVIPPEDRCIKVIPPENPVLDTKPVVIKLKLKPKQSETNTVNTQSIQNNSQLDINTNTNLVLQPVSKPQEQIVVHEPVQNSESNIEILKYNIPVESKQEPVVQPTIEKPTENIIEPKDLTDEDLFNNTGTEYSKKSLWMEYFEKAKSSRKSNPIVDRMRVGRFTITPDNKVLLLPDYDIVGKDPDDVLKDKWF